MKAEDSSGRPNCIPSSHNKRKYLIWCLKFILIILINDIKMNEILIFHCIHGPQMIC